MQSRLPVYLHPLAGRPLCWYAVRALASREPPPRAIVLAATPDLPPDLFRDFAPPVYIVGSPHDALDSLPEAGAVIVVDAAAPTLEPVIDALLRGDDDALAVAAPGADAGAVRLDAASAHEVVRSASSAPRWTDALPASLVRVEDPRAAVVFDRAGLGRAAIRVHDDTVARLMDGGVTFLLPETNHVDIDVRIGRDSVIYPGVVLEGQTTIGEETVIGPGSRILDSWIGSGVEMKGWNYIAHTSVRNRAILEPYARRGRD